MLGSVFACQGSGGFKVWSDYDAATLDQRLGDDLGSRKVFHLPGNLGLHPVSQIKLRGQQNGASQNIVLGLRQEVSRNPSGVGGLVSDHHRFGRAGQPIQTNKTIHLLLGQGDE